MQPFFEEIYNAIHNKLDKKIDQHSIENVEKDIETDIFKRSKQEFVRLWIAYGSSMKVWTSNYLLKFYSIVL